MSRGPYLVFADSGDVVGGVVGCFVLGCYW